MRHEKTDFKVFVVVIPKEGWASVAVPILLLTWHRLFENIIYDVSRVKFRKVGVIPKEGWARPFGMTTTKTLRSLFSWPASYENICLFDSPWQWHLSHMMLGCLVLDADLMHDTHSGDRGNVAQLYCTLNPNISPKMSERKSIYLNAVNCICNKNKIMSISSLFRRKQLHWKWLAFGSWLLVYTTQCSYLNK